MLLFQPTEFSRIRLQYNYDIASHLKTDGLGSNAPDAGSVWMGFEVLIGTHPPHKY
jgi:hypothetical protein